MNKINPKSILAISLTLIIAMSTLIVLLPIVNAQVTEIETNAYVMLAPDPIGVGQTLLVSYRIDKVRAGATDVANHFEGFEVTITKPDATKEVKSNLKVDSTSGGWFIYNPTQVGTYTFQTKFPAQWSNGTQFGQPYNYLYLASESSVVELTVQQDPIEGIPNNPIPEDQWKRPIYAENKGWNSVADNWLMRNYDHPNRGFCVTTAFSPYTSAPESAHILWSKPIIFGGQGGGKFGDTSYYTGLSYEQFYIPLILEGRIIYTEHGPTTTTPLGTRIMDLYTGEEIMYLEGVDIIFAQVLDIDNPNEHGLIAYLWSSSGSSSNSTLTMYDGFTGRELLKVVNVTWGGLGGFNGGPTAMGPKGEILSYTFRGSGADRTLLCWNSTKAIYSRGGIDTWSPAFGSTIEGSRGIEYEVPAVGTDGLSIFTTGEGYILAEKRDTNVFPYLLTDVCFNSATGQQLWARNRTEIYTAFFAGAMSIRDGIYTLRDEGKMCTYAYDIKTGNQLWRTDSAPNGWGIFEYQQDMAYGKLYTTGYTGKVRAYDTSDGQHAWAFDMGSSGYETVYGVYPSYNGFTVADGKIFVTNDEHSPDGVLWRGSRLYAINTDNGEEVWSINGMLRNPAVADGMLTAINSYDGKVYTFGKGPTKITVNTPDVAVSQGTKVVIKGSITDESPGQPGTPAISDESMATWMEYLHMQKPIPGDATGVPVTITAVAPNGNAEVIGTTTSDMGGSYGIEWTPNSQGLYQIMVTFEGSNSYDSSYATTYLSVGPSTPAASPTVPPTTAPPVTTAPPTVTASPTSSPPPTAEPPTEQAPTDVYIIAAVAAVVIIVAAAAAILLRRRK